MFPRQLDAAFRGIRLDRSVTLELQNIANQLEIFRVVFDYQYQCARHDLA